MKTVVKDLVSIPCTNWVQKLAARHQDDLSLADRQALNAHLALCGACNQVYMTYKTLETAMCGLTTTSLHPPIPEFTYEPLQAVRKPFLLRSALSLQSFPLLVLTILSFLYLRLSLSPLCQELHTWMLVILSRFPRKVAYASSDNRFLYVMRTDSGYFLWRHKRYKRQELVSNSSIRGSGMLFIGSGVALAAALDFCEYAVQA
jgi:hypothetical protein